MRRFESSRPSQPVRHSEKPPLMVLEMPANGGLLRISDRSPNSKCGPIHGEIADSLWRIFKIFPFPGNGGWRPGSICTALPVKRLYPAPDCFRTLLLITPEGERQKFNNLRFYQRMVGFEQCELARRTSGLHPFGTVLEIRSFRVTYELRGKRVRPYISDGR